MDDGTNHKINKEDTNEKLDELVKELQRRKFTSCDEKYFNCSECFEAFGKEYLLRKHISKYHSPVKEYTCELCNENFRSSNAYKTHCMVNHNQHRPFKCAECKKRFTLESALILHKRIHSNRKDFRCKLCGQTFVQQSTLNNHLERHSGERKYSCEDCQKNFPTKSDLVSHRKLHIIKSSFTCEHCGLTFNKKSNYKRHLLKHTGERSFECEYCEKSYFRKQHLLHHVKIHLKEKSFVCKICNEVFSKSNDFLNHKRTHTKEKIPSTANPVKTEELKKKNNETKKENMKGIVIKIGGHPNTRNIEIEKKGKGQLQREFPTGNKVIIDNTNDILNVTDRQFLSNEYFLTSHMTSQSFLSLLATTDYQPIEAVEQHEQFSFNSNSLKNNNFMTELLSNQTSLQTQIGGSTSVINEASSGLKAGSEENESFSLNRLHNPTDLAHPLLCKEHDLLEIDLSSREVLDANAFLNDDY